MIKYFKNLLTSVLFWFRPILGGQIQIEPTPSSSLEQDVRMNQEKLEVNLDEWEGTMQVVFKSDNFVTEGIERAVRPSDEVLKKQIASFYKDYSRVIKKTDQLFTKNIINIGIKENED
jgi:hypothetical protein